MNSEKDSMPSSDIARATLKRLAQLRIPPTPDNFHKIYNQIAGKPYNQVSEAYEKIMIELAKEFPRHTQDMLDCVNNLEKAAHEKNWFKYKSTLVKYLTIDTTYLDNSKISIQPEYIPRSTRVEIIENLFKQPAGDQFVSNVIEKRKSLMRIFGSYSNDPTQLQEELTELFTLCIKEPSTHIRTADSKQFKHISALGSDNEVAISNVQPGSSVTSFEEEHVMDDFIEQHAELMSKFLECSTFFLNEDAPLVIETRKLAQQARKIQSRHDMKQFMDCLKQFYTKLVSYKGNSVTLQQGLLKLFNLLIKGIEQLFSEDRWIKAQIAKIKDTMSESLSMESIAQTEHYLKEIFEIKKYERNRLAEAREIMKITVASLVTNLEELSDETGAYQEKLEYFSGKINKCNEVEDLSQLIDEIVHETKQVQKNLLDYRDIILTSRAEAYRTQHQINLLETKLQELNEKAHVDYLTGALNRRGFDAAYQRALSFATRKQNPLCFALIDIDNFKLFNDTYGHDVGDNVLIHLVEAIKEIIRLEDIVSRYGGEEFAILLPETKLEDAAQVILKVHRHLTKKFFLHENKRILITFSAGIAQLQPGESLLSLYQRADKGLYRAKKNGKNQVIVET